MNILHGIIEKITTDQVISVIEVQVEDTRLSAMTTAPTDAGLPLAIGDKVQLRFKETAVSIGKDLSGVLSIRNKLDGRILSLTEDKLLTKLTLDFKGHQLVSVITTASAERMKLQPGDFVEGLVKTTDMLLTKTDG